MHPTLDGRPLALDDKLDSHAEPVCCGAAMARANSEPEGFREYRCAACSIVVDVDDEGIVWGICQRIAWWPHVVAAANRDCSATGRLLDRATPRLDDGVLRLAFADPAEARTWRESGAQAAFEGALAHCGQEMPVEVVNLTE